VMKYFRENVKLQENRADVGFVAQFYTTLCHTIRFRS
jgi:hypothetical protein